MAHKISWDNQDKTVVLQEYLPGAIKDDLYLLAKESAELLGTVSHKVYLIIDERNIQLTLNSADMRFLERNVPPNQGDVVVIPAVGSLMFKEMMRAIGAGIAPKAFGEPYFAKNVEEARQVLMREFGVIYP
jgi:hypothetical protein